MRGQKVKAREFEFNFSQLDTSVLVECLDADHVVIRATRDTFSDLRKILFIHELAAEGFIPDVYQWYPTAAGELQWIVDHSWLRLHSIWTQRSNSFMRRLLVYGGLLWLTLMTLLVCSSFQPRQPDTAAAAPPNFPAAANDAGK